MSWVSRVLEERLQKIPPPNGYQLPSLAGHRKVITPDPPPLLRGLASFVMLQTMVLAFSFVSSALISCPGYINSIALEFNTSDDLPCLAL